MSQMSFCFTLWQVQLDRVDSFHKLCWVVSHVSLLRSVTGTTQEGKVSRRWRPPSTCLSPLMPWCSRTASGSPRAPQRPSADWVPVLQGKGRMCCCQRGQTDGKGRMCCCRWGQTDGKDVVWIELGGLFDLRERNKGGGGWQRGGETRG